MNTKFESHLATLVSPGGVVATFDGCSTSMERDEIILGHVHIGKITRNKINRVIAEEKCETAHDALKVLRRFATGEDRAMQIIARAAGDYLE